MIIVLTTLWFCYILGFVSFVTCQPTPATKSKNHDNNEANTQIDPELFAKALTHAKTMIISDTSTASKNNNKNNNPQTQNQLIQQLQSGNIEALYTVAQSLNRRNAGDDRITSVQLWHALADGPAHHVPSAVALGFSYSEVDKYTALQYFLQAADGKDTEDGGPHQAALFNAGRLFLELNDAASSLAYIRACATVERSYPNYASAELTNTCKDAYQTLSDQIQSESTTPPGIEDAAEMFLYSSMNEFPSPNSKEFGVWSRAMEYLEKYADVVRSYGQNGNSNDGNGKTYLVLAQQELQSLQSSSSGKMSELQKYLVGTILGRVQLLLTAMEVGGEDEL